MTDTTNLVQIRTPTYRRPKALSRALRSMQAQTWSNWVCDVYDDDPQGSAETVCLALADPRIVYHRNVRQNFASMNIDQCFSRNNPHGAEYFCVVEDDNFILDTFLEANIALCKSQGVDIVLRNQLFEHASGTDAAYLGTKGVLDDVFTNGLYDPLTFRTSLLMGIGVSNGGLFWSRHARSELEIQYNCTATLQEYLRTFSIREPIYVAMEPLAVWAENAEQTTRNAGLNTSYLRRELNLKRNVQRLRRAVWNELPAEARKSYLDSERFAAPPAVRADGLVRSMIWHQAGAPLPPVQTARTALRSGLVAAFGRSDAALNDFIASRRATSRVRSSGADYQPRGAA
ncbi:glycosyltransferase family A protein [Devosia sp. SL43]|uniref:glycosyltransferase family A protein n=1 Tax=Devosia sp. SL43 TaxID=2806348 RepID=UPI001F2F2CDC|nr:glycosyltransferase family A protein [Devosia sp. SL43]UJW87438.1 glycosyltransferase family 2 protein [Devosia sp. SL43]